MSRSPLKQIPPHSEAVENLGEELLLSGRLYLREQEDELRAQLSDYLGVDRWVEDVIIPTLAPRRTAEVARLLSGNFSPYIPLGSATSLGPRWNPPSEGLVVLMIGLKEKFELVPQAHTITVSSGFPVGVVKERLKASGYGVAALERFNSGTIGGRLSLVPSMVSLDPPCDWVHSLLALEVVLANGQVVQLGSRALKDVAGYDLRHLFTGSRGMLGIITSATFRILPWERLPPCQSLPHLPSHPPRIQLKNLFDPKGRLLPALPFTA